MPKATTARTEIRERIASRPIVGQVHAFAKRKVSYFWIFTSALSLIFSIWYFRPCDRERSVPEGHGASITGESGKSLSPLPPSA